MENNVCYLIYIKYSNYNIALLFLSAFISFINGFSLSHLSVYLWFYYFEINQYPSCMQ